MNCVFCSTLKKPKLVPAVSGRLFCDPCLPENREVLPAIRHGYYLAQTGLRYGDTEFAEEAERLYLGLGVTKKAAGPFNGVSVFEPEPGKIVRRATLHNLFALSPEKPLTYDFGEK